MFHCLIHRLIRECVHTGVLEEVPDDFSPVVGADLCSVGLREQEEPAFSQGRSWISLEMGRGEGCRAANALGVRSPRCARDLQAPSTEPFVSSLNFVARPGVFPGHCDKNASLVLFIN